MKEIVAVETAPITSAQRLGYLLESVDAGKLVAPLKDYVRINSRRSTALLPGTTHIESHLAENWNLRINTSIETVL